MCEISHSTDYISVSCNRYSHCIDFKNGWICLAAKYSVAIYCIQSFKVLKLLNGHKNQVNSVEWIKSNDNLLISSSSDKTSIIWDLNDFNDCGVKYQLIGHKESIIVSRCYQLNDNQLLSISSSTDKSIKIWLNDKQICELFANNFIFDIKVCKNGNIFDDFVIITVGANETIDLYQFNLNNHQINSLIEIKGHEDWIRSIDIIETKDSVVLATSSQDSFIRVHTIERIDNEETEINQKMFSVVTKDSTNKYLVNLETVLSGHEGWVSEVRWTHSSDNCLRLLSASMDKTMILWEPPNDGDLNGHWIESMRVGEMGGNTLGFLGCAASSQFDMIVGYSFNGALHCWKSCANEWSPYAVISGHFDEVTDIAWEPKGEYLLSCSKDQTTRLHSRWLTSNNESITWHELARPQIHGYDIKCISMIDRHSFVSGADEKVVRLFRATKCFASSLKHISDVDITDTNKEEEVAHSAVVPTLGLSNCAVYEPGQLDQEFRPTILNVPPTEEALLQNTLWPEIHKLYGHVFELFSVATSNSGTLMASASKATKGDHAHIILWHIKEAKQLTKLSSHQLTVTRIRFSSDDRLILSASRDRTWALFERDHSDKYTRIGFSDKKNGIHSRIIWDIAFTFDNQYFCSVSRDKSAVFWRINSDRSTHPSTSLGPVSACESPLILKDSITALDICGLLFGNNYLVAFGLENGNICLYFWNPNTFWTHLLHLNDRHYLTINRLLFSPKIERLSEQQIRVYIGSCGSDHSLHIFNILIKLKSE